MYSMYMYIYIYDMVIKFIYLATMRSGKVFDVYIHIHILYIYTHTYSVYIYTYILYVYTYT